MDKEQKAFERLRLGAEMSKQYYNAPLILCYSGGKDSDVLVQLALNSVIDEIRDFLKECGFIEASMAVEEYREQ